MEINSYFSLFALFLAESYFDRRAAQFPFRDWAHLPISAALARLQGEVNSVAELGEEIRQVSADIQDHRSRLASLKAEKAELDGQVQAAGHAVHQAKAAKAQHEDKVQSLAEQSKSLLDQIVKQERKMADRQARLQSISNEVASLEDAAQRIAESFNQADQKLLQVLALVGASSLGQAENIHLLRMTMS